MKIRVVSTCYNEREMLPFYLRHYAEFADKIILYDDHSTDGSFDSAKSCKKVLVRDWPFESGLIDDLMLALWQHVVAEAKRDEVDWLMIPDIDEILYSPIGLRQTCFNASEAGYQVIAAEGWNMTGEGLPRDDGQSQIWQLLQTGVPSTDYSKPIIVNPKADVAWNRGRHALENCSPNVSPMPMVKLLHYRYLGRAYTARRNARNYKRVGADKGCAWSNAPDYHGQHSAQWAEAVKQQSVNAITT